MSISSPLNAAELSPWDIDYCNEDHVKAFADALSIVEPIEGDQSPLSPKSPPIGLLDTPASSQSPQWNHGPSDESLLGDGNRAERVKRLTATSDFAGFIFLIISVEFGAYVLTRQIVNVFEYLLAWRGHKSILRRNLRMANTYDEWVKAAKALDTHLGFDEWKETEEDSYFDTALVKRVKRTLTRLRSAKDTRGLMDALAICVRSNFAGTESVKMYSETFYGTKNLVEAHLNEVAACLDTVRTATDVSLEEKRSFFRAVNKNYGSSALCCSGGASFGYYHFGVVKAFLDADLLPRVITGTSAGGIVAALLCTRTDSELRELLVPQLADKITACEDSMKVWLKRFWQTGARFSTLQWARKAMFFTRGSLTFKEAYERTGRALNVSVVPSDRHSPTILLNHLTAPNCLIWSAIIASAAVPGILNSVRFFIQIRSGPILISAQVVLMAKDRNGQVKPHNLGGSRFKDGSLREDIPLGSLHTQFNCNFSIVSQTNPHIHLFFFAPRGSVGRPVAHRKGKGWRGGFILSALESYIKLDLSKHFKVIRDLDLMPQILQSDWSGVFLQRFSGDLTLTPRSTIRDWTRILSDPDRTDLARMLSVGEKVTWPALRMVRNRMIIERAILRGRAEVRAALHRDRTTNDRGSPQPTDGHSSSQVPIESDADAGFAKRSKKIQQAGINFGEGSNSVRRRKVVTPKNKSPSFDNIELAPPSSSRFGHVRASSFSPFRSMRASTAESPTRTTRQGSRMSISRWFSNQDGNSSSDEDDFLRVDSPSGDDSAAGAPRFVFDGDTSASAILDDGEGEGDGDSDEEILSPGAGRAGEEGGVDALRPSLSATKAQYSPPQQDVGDEH
ncbi:hypothetical protein P7C73_g3007, partial [Tremellales sp. Uapishka_1]